MAINTPTKSTVLVTGGTGFVASHCSLQPLQQGYPVRTTIRSLLKKDQVLSMMREGGIKDPDNLEFAEADLNKDAVWEQAIAGCQYVLHVASPIGHTPKDENEMIRPAVDGTLRVLKAARDAGVKRVVMTSNFSAVGFSHTDTSKVITEESWIDPLQKHDGKYGKCYLMQQIDMNKKEKARKDIVLRAFGFGCYPFRSGRQD